MVTILNSSGDVEENNILWQVKISMSLNKISENTNSFISKLSAAAFIL